MRHSLTQFICLAVMLVVAREFESDEKRESDNQTARSKPIRVLFIGNSQFGKWNIPQMVQELSESAPPQGTRLDCDGLIKAGAWLQTHQEDPKTRAKLDSKQWDIVVLQEHYRVPSKTGRRKFFDSARALHNEIAKRHAKTVLYASPNVGSNGHEGFAAIHAVNVELATKLNVPIAPAGAACLKVWKKQPNLDLHHTDRRHPNYKAAYISACVLYATLTGKSPIGLTNKCGKGAVSTEEAQQFQSAAWEQYLETNPRKQP